jgi:uncharacterized protein (TIGR02996 family)
VDTDSPFLAAVLAQPWQDQPRLEFADDISRRGEEQRGEFVRLQVGLATGRYPGLARPVNGSEMAEVAYSMRWLDLQSNESRLRLNAAPIWASPVAALAGGWEFQRGFIWCASTSAALFLDRGEELLSLAPITFVRLTRVKPVLDRLLESPLLARLESLSLADNGLNDDDALRLANCPNLVNIWWLDASHNPIGEPGLRSIVTGPGLRNLWYLGLDGNEFDPRETFGREGLTISDARLPESGERLEAELGPVRWLHYHPELGSDYPPGPYQPPPVKT